MALVIPLLQGKRYLEVTCAGDGGSDCPSSCLMASGEGECVGLQIGEVQNQVFCSIFRKVLSEQFQIVLEAGKTGCCKASQLVKLHFWLNIAFELWVMGLALFASE